MSEHGSRSTRNNRKLGVAVTALAAGGLAAGGIAVASSASAAPLQVTNSITTTSANIAKAASRHADTNKITEARKECEAQLDHMVRVSTASSTVTESGGVYTVTYVFNCDPA